MLVYHASRASPSIALALLQALVNLYEGLPYASGDSISSSVRRWRFAPSLVQEKSVTCAQCPRLDRSFSTGRSEDAKPRSSVYFLATNEICCLPLGIEILRTRNSKPENCLIYDVPYPSFGVSPLHNFSTRTLLAIRKKGYMNASGRCR